jgi:hypothetical protein
MLAAGGTSAAALRFRHGTRRFAGAEQEGDMADRQALGIIGYILCGVTAVVMVIGATVLNGHLADPSKIPSGYYGVTLSAKSR